MIHQRLSGDDPGRCAVPRRRGTAGPAAVRHLPARRGRRLRRRPHPQHTVDRAAAGHGRISVSGLPGARTTRALTGLDLAAGTAAKPDAPAFWRSPPAARSSSGRSAAGSRTSGWTVGCTPRWARALRRAAVHRLAARRYRPGVKIAILNDLVGQGTPTRPRSPPAPAPRHPVATAASPTVPNCSKPRCSTTAEAATTRGSSPASGGPASGRRAVNTSRGSGPDDGGPIRPTSRWIG